MHKGGEGDEGVKKKVGRERDITIWVEHPRDKSNSWWLVRVIFCKLQSKLERAYIDVTYSQ